MKMKPKPRPVKKKRPVYRNSLSQMSLDGFQMTPSSLRQTQHDLFADAETADALRRMTLEPPLITAVKAGDYDLVHSLCAGGDDVSIQDDEGMTPLHWAVKQNDVDMVRLLMLHDADPKEEDNDFESPIGLSIRMRHDSCYNAMIDATMLQSKVPVIEFDEEDLEKSSETKVKHWPTVMPAQVGAIMFA
jgi:hypothetical protein